MGAKLRMKRFLISALKVSSNVGQVQVDTPPQTDHNPGGYDNDPKIFVRTLTFWMKHVVDEISAE